MNTRHALISTFGLGALGLSLHCGSSANDEGGYAGAGGGVMDGGGVSGSGGTAGSGGGAGGGADAAAPPEEELEGSFLSPVATGRYVWSANPDSGRVALVDALSLEIRVVEAGFGPTYLAAVPDPQNENADVAIVLNVLSDDATLFRAEPGGTVAIETLETHQGANAWAISPGGKWAIAWTDAGVVEDADPTEGFQDVTVISLAPGNETATRLTVGYRPTRIAFDAAETRAFAVTEPGISVLSLAAPEPSIVDLIAVSDDPLENPASRDVTITPDGNLAIVRRDGSADVTLVDLATGQRSALTLSGAVTDLDLNVAGTLAVAVIRENSEVALLPIPEIAQDPSALQTTTIAGELFGSVALSADSAKALLFTNAVDNDHLTIVDIASGQSFLTHRTVTVKTPVKAVFPAPDALHAITLQSPGAGSSKAGAFSVVPTAALVSPKIVGTDAPPMAVAIAPPPSERALVTVRDDANEKFGAYLVRMPNLQVDLIPLASPPLATGIVPAAGKGYVAQKHPEGRITFVDFADGSVRTLTGFELGAKVVD